MWRRICRSLGREGCCGLGRILSLLPGLFLHPFPLGLGELAALKPFLEHCCWSFICRWSKAAHSHRGGSVGPTTCRAAVAELWGRIRRSFSREVRCGLGRILTRGLVVFDIAGITGRTVSQSM